MLPLPDATPRRFVISGCSGGGKSTLIAALAGRGFQTFPEPGRIIVKEEMATGGSALPWKDTTAFATRAIAMSLANWRASGPGLSFHDRCFIDQLSWFASTGTELPPDNSEIAVTHRFETTVFLVPPWPDLYQSDDERRHDLAAAIREYEALRHFYPSCGYTITELPRTKVAERVSFILARTTATTYDLP